MKLHQPDVVCDACLLIGPGQKLALDVFQHLPDNPFTPRLSLRRHRLALSSRLIQTVFFPQRNYKQAPGRATREAWILLIQKGK